ncbi:T9SS type A sorting domain-containing protein [Adhaeribacter soli]|nr:T9SS type A sorting domain-containing protein [Adhaeribacter soli]
MKNNTFLKSLVLGCLISAFLPFSSNAQNGPAKQWDKTFGGSNEDAISSIKQTSDGGYIMGGNSQSGQNGSKSEPSRGISDFWVVKTDGNGNKIWDKTFGGSEPDGLSALHQTSDGGYILGGWSRSGQSGDKTQPLQMNQSPYEDFWIVKIDASGNKVWDKSFGGVEPDWINDLQVTSDGGFIFGGSSGSGQTGDKSQINVGSNDIWIVKTDALGNKAWDKTFGGTDSEVLTSIKQTPDGGYVLGGPSRSGQTGDKSQPGNGGTDYWIIKIDAQGNKQWDKTFGGADNDELAKIELTNDGGYILGGNSQSGQSGDKSEPGRGMNDYWVIKLDGSGNKVWDKTFGGNSADILTDLDITLDGGYFIGGISYSGISGDKSQNLQGTTDGWFLKLDANGTKVWDRTIGGADGDVFNALQQTSDGGYILGAGSYSGMSRDKSQISEGQSDFWVVKLGPDVLGAIDEISTSKIQLFQNQPNPFSKHTSINFNLAKPEEVALTVYNSLGQTVAKQRKKYVAGQHQVQWQELVQNRNLKAGTYFYQLTAEGFQDTKRMILLNA